MPSEPDPVMAVCLLAILGSSATLGFLFSGPQAALDVWTAVAAGLAALWAADSGGDASADD